MNHELRISARGGKNKRKNLFPIYNSGKSAGFTLLEILVVLTIIGMLLSFVFIMITGTKAKGRDAKREQDIGQIKNALQLYITSSGTFPICNPKEILNGTTDCLSLILVPGGAIASISTDPINTSGSVPSNCGDDGVYVYCYESIDGSDYTISYNLEGDEIQGKSAGWQSVTP